MKRHKRLRNIFPVLTLSLFLLVGCVQPAPGSRPWLLDEQVDPPSFSYEIEGESELHVGRDANTPYLTPTPDTPHNVPTIRANSEYYVVQPGDYLAAIAYRYNTDIATLIETNALYNANQLEIGQTLIIPAPNPTATPSDFKIIPDSELVYGPVSSTFQINEFLEKNKGYLAQYSEEVDEKPMSGAQIVSRVAYEYSINPRLLLTLLEYKSGWVASSKPDAVSRDYPMGVMEESRKGLYRQLAWTANQLNRAYYLWQIDAVAYANLASGGIVPLSPVINAGTAAVQYTIAQISSASEWQKAVSENGVFSLYSRLFSIPFDLTIEPLVPANLSQPEMLLPFEPGAVWSFTSGPHGAWGDGSAWAALDFAPPGTAFGCFQSNAWVTAVADGVIVRSGDGAVVQDLDGDGFEQTGWTVLYMHIESRDRIAAGTTVKAGDRIGHPSCEGGVSNGTHVHIARRYNGEWISADGAIPFVLSGWVSAGQGVVYSGILTRNGQTILSWDGRIAENQIQR